jgi:predicted Zn-dependent protease with MMP-like domain
MNRTDFGRAIHQALDELPPELRRHIANVAIVVEEQADAETLVLAGVDNPLDLLGFYHGIPLTERTHDYGLVLPDKISIYRRPILQVCKTDAEVRTCIKQTVRHELAHYFGWDDDQLEKLGAY